MPSALGSTFDGKEKSSTILLKIGKARKA